MSRKVGIGFQDRLRQASRMVRMPGMPPNSRMGQSMFDVPFAIIPSRMNLPDVDLLTVLPDPSCVSERTESDPFLFDSGAFDPRRIVKFLEETPKPQPVVPPCDETPRATRVENLGEDPNQLLVRLQFEYQSVVEEDVYWWLIQHKVKGYEVFLEVGQRSGRVLSVGFKGIDSQNRPEFIGGLAHILESSILCARRPSGAGEVPVPPPTHLNALTIFAIVEANIDEVIRSLETQAGDPHTPPGGRL